MGCNTTTRFSNSIFRILLKKKLRNYPLNFNWQLMLSCNNYIHPSIWNCIKKSKFPATIRLSYRNSVFSCTKSRFTAIGSKQPFFGFQIIRSKRYSNALQDLANYLHIESMHAICEIPILMQKKKKKRISQRFCIVRITRQVGNYFE